jgi:succinyl-diaminopimelate desuccinylase
MSPSAQQTHTTERTDPVEIARALIRCRSVTPKDGGALTYLAGLLSQAGFATEIVRFSEAGTADVDNLFARIGTHGPHLAFAGHTDVVPPGEEGGWSHPPFAAEIAAGRLYGRGAVDMKGGIACFVAAALDHLSARGPLSGSIMLLITGDEEGVSINGTRKLLDWARARGERFDHCLVGEPTNREALGDMIKIGRRGSLSGTITVTGKQGHSAYPHLARNPIRGLARVLDALFGEPLDQGTDVFDASSLEVTSVDVGNPAFNVIPAEVAARFNIRFNDLHTAASLRERVSGQVEAALAGTNLEGSVAYEPNPAEAFRTEAGDVAALLSETIVAETGRKPVLSTTGGTSDARYIKDYCPVIEFGLVGQTMHQVDENVAVADLQALTAIYRRFLERYFDRFGT